MIIPRNLLFRQDFTCNEFVLRQSRRMPCKLHWGSPQKPRRIVLELIAKPLAVLN